MATIEQRRCGIVEIELTTSSNFKNRTVSDIFDKNKIKNVFFRRFVFPFSPSSALGDFSSIDVVFIFAHFLDNFEMRARQPIFDRTRKGRSDVPNGYSKLLHFLFPNVRRGETRDRPLVSSLSFNEFFPLQ